MKSFFVLSLLTLALALALLGWEEIFSPREAVETHFQEGTRLLDAGAWFEASREFRFALLSSDPALLAAAHHNLALAFLQLSLEGKGPSALQWAQESILHGEEALRIHPGSHDSAWNLELAQRRAGALADEERMRGAGSAERLLTSFRLQEESGLGEVLQRRLREPGEGMAAPALKGLPW